jgi:hypothetical protein
MSESTGEYPTACAGDSRIGTGEDFPVTGRPEWQSEAACRGAGPDNFMAAKFEAGTKAGEETKKQRIARLRRIAGLCARCTVQRECIRGAFDTGKARTLYLKAIGKTAVTDGNPRYTMLRAVGVDITKHGFTSSPKGVLEEIADQASGN